MINIAILDCKTKLIAVLEASLGRIRSNKIKKKWVKLCNAIKEKSA
jgi:hypothetical protein